MTARRDIIAIVVFLVIVLALWMSFSMLPSPRTVYIGSGEGERDLRGADFTDTVYVIGSMELWESYPFNLFTPEDFALGITGEPTVTQLSDYRSIDYFTHRITLFLTPGRIYNMSMRTADYSQRIFVCGDELEGVGMPATSREEVIPGAFEKIYSFIPQTEQVEIIIQTANFVHGIIACRPPVISIGDSFVINALDRRAVFFKAVVLGCLLTSVLHHISVFIMNRRRTSSLIFSIWCLILAMMDKTLLYAFFPDISWYLDVRLEYLVLFLIALFLILFLYAQFPKLLHNVIAVPYCALLILHIFSLFFSTRFFTAAAIYFSYVSIAFIVYIVARFAMSLRRGKQYVLGFVGMLVLGLFGISDLLHNRDHGELISFTSIPFAASVGMVFFVFCFTLSLSLEYAEKERRAEKAAFFERMSHEMLTPLTRISTDVQVVQKHPERAGERLLETQTEIMAMAEKIRNALDEKAGDDQ